MESDRVKSTDFSEQHRGSDRVKLKEFDIKWKMPLCKWLTFEWSSCLICYFIVKLFYAEWKWLLMKNLIHNVSHNPTFEAEIVLKISAF